RDDAHGLAAVRARLRPRSSRARRPRRFAESGELKHARRARADEPPYAPTRSQKEPRHGVSTGWCGEHAWWHRGWSQNARPRSALPSAAYSFAVVARARSLRSLG